MAFDLDAELEKIAQTKLRILTLQTRKRDRLDFHEVAVWSLKEALEMAFHLGREHTADYEPPEKCPDCQEPYTQKDIDGGRCLCCGAMIK